MFAALSCHRPNGVPQWHSVVDDYEEAFVRLNAAIRALRTFAQECRDNSARHQSFFARRAPGLLPAANVRGDFALLFIDMKGMPVFCRFLAHNLFTICLTFVSTD